MAFAHLHLHTQYSLLDGACRLGELCAAAKELGMTSVAMTDHGNMYGAVEFYKAAHDAGIKPILGCEVYVAPRRLTDKVHGPDSERYHLVLLCENETGYRNLIHMVSRAWVDGFYVRPRVDKELLEAHHEGLIALSACLAGEIPRLLTSGNYEGAKQTALWYDRVFGRGNFYLELQDHGLPEQQVLCGFRVFHSIADTKLRPDFAVGKGIQDLSQTVVVGLELDLQGVVELVSDETPLVVVVLFPVALKLPVHMEAERFKIRPLKPEGRKDLHKRHRILP